MSGMPVQHDGRNKALVERLLGQGFGGQTWSARSSTALPHSQGLLLPSASASLQLGEQTNCALPSKRRLLSWLRGRCLPHRKHDIVAAPKAPAAVNGEPGVLLR